MHPAPGTGYPTARIGASEQSGIADIRDFNLLQVINRWWPCFQHLARQGQTHPQ